MTQERFETHRGPLHLTLNRFFLEYLCRIYQAFDGDIATAIVLGRVAHHNFLPWVAEAGGDVRRLGELLSQPALAFERLPANAHSISLSTGIPRETVRRKLAALVAQGWLEDNGRSEYFVTSAPGNHFAPMTHELLLLLLGTADDLRSLLEIPPAQATTARQKRG